MLPRLTCPSRLSSSPNSMGSPLRDNRTRELAMSRDRGPLCKVKMVA